ncbi:MAG: hypothetical protein MSS94_03095, partial [Clostridiales bacterium]|nr:hypothetical protein [Clostridiales bacterium]
SASRSKRKNLPKGWGETVNRLLCKGTGDPSPTKRIDTEFSDKFQFAETQSDTERVVLHAVNQNPNDCRWQSYLRQHRTMGTAGFGGSFAPIVQYEKWEIHPVFPHFSYFRSGQNLSPNLLAPLCGAALN